MVLAGEVTKYLLASKLNSLNAFLGREGASSLGRSQVLNVGVSGVVAVCGEDCPVILGQEPG